jgi:hypothetical protein
VGSAAQRMGLAAICSGPGGAMAARLPGCQSDEGGRYVVVLL